MARPANYPQQDRDAGLQVTTLGDKEVTKYDPEMALKILERLAQGELLKKICEKGAGFCTQTTFMRWVARVPELKTAYLAARALSAQTFEEESLELARDLVTSRGVTAQEVSAANSAMAQFRWSASKRDPQTYGERAGGAIVVPVHIQSSLNLGEGVVSGVEIPDIYTIEVKPEPQPDPKQYIEQLDVSKLGSEKTAIGHRPNVGRAGPYLKKNPFHKTMKQINEKRQAKKAAEANEPV